MSSLLILLLFLLLYTVLYFGVRNCNCYYRYLYVITCAIDMCE